MSKGGGGGTQTVTQNNIPAEMAPYDTQIFQQAQKLYNNGGLAKSYYPNSTVTPFSSDTLKAQQMIASRAQNGSPLQTAGKTTNAATANGQFLNSNPFIDQVYNSAAKRLTDVYSNVTAPSTDSAFAKGGRFGSGLAANAQQQNKQVLGNSLGDLANNMYYGNYNDERSRQQQTSLLAPDLSAADYNDANQLSAVGAQKENLSQQQLAEQMARYYDNPQVNALTSYSSLIQGAQPKQYSQSSTVTPRTSALAGGLGGLASGAAMGAQIGSVIPGIGTGIGAIGGGILGGIGGIFG